VEYYLAAYKTILWSLALTLPRISVAAAMIPLFSRQMLPMAMIKNGIMISFSLMVLPTVYGFQVDSAGYGEAGAIIIKEMFLGLLLGFLVAIPFWIIEGVGFFIDNQRGSTLSEILNPLTGSQTSPMGVMLSQTATAIFVTSGGLLGFLGLLYSSYKVWPILTFMPDLHLKNALFFIDQLDDAMMLIVVLSAPIIIAMFLSEFCFALVNRFAQQLNVFILAMPVKSAIALFMLIIYLQSLFYFFDQYQSGFPLILKQLVKVTS